MKKLHERWRDAANKLHEAATELMDVQADYERNSEVPELLLEEISDYDVSLAETIAADVSDEELFKKLEKCGE